MDKVELFENERASGYNQFVEKWIPNYHYFLNHLPKFFTDNKQKELLVVGCGTGNEIEQFINSSNNWLITGVDPSPEMIDQAKNKFESRENVTLIKGLISELNIEKKYDAATILLVLHFLEDNGAKLSLLKDISKRLVSGAKLVLLDITGNKKQIQENLKILEFLLPEGLSPEEIKMRLNRIENELHAVSEERLCDLLEEAGFEKPTRFFQSAIYMGWLTVKK